MSRNSLGMVRWICRTGASLNFRFSSTTDQQENFPRVRLAILVVFSARGFEKKQGNIVSTRDMTLRLHVPSPRPNAAITCLPITVCSAGKLASDRMRHNIIEGNLV